MFEGKFMFTSDLVLCNTPHMQTCKMAENELIVVSDAASVDRDAGSSTSWSVDRDAGSSTSWSVDRDAGSSTSWSVDRDAGSSTSWSVDRDAGSSTSWSQLQERQELARPLHRELC